MGLKILISLDGTPQAERALRYAELLVRVAGGQLQLFQASVGGGPTDYLERVLDSIAKRLQATGVPTKWSVVAGNAVPAILDAARAWRPDIIAMATTRSSALDRCLNDGVADAIVRSAKVPVLVVPPDREHPSARKAPVRIMVPLDGSAIAEEALAPATELARSLQADLILLRVVEEDNSGGPLHAREAENYMQKMLDGVAPAFPQQQVISHVASGSPTIAIAQTVIELAIDLVAMSTRGRGGFVRALMGSTATATLEHSTVPLLIVGPAAMRSTACGQATRTRQMGAPDRTASNDPPGRSPEGLDPEAVGATAHARTAVAHTILARPDYDAIDEQGRQSFPASDPPSWTGSTI